MAYMGSNGIMVSNDKVIQNKDLNEVLRSQFLNWLLRDNVPSEFQQNNTVGFGIKRFLLSGNYDVLEDDLISNINLFFKNEKDMSYFNLDSVVFSNHSVLIKYSFRTEDEVISQREEILNI